MPLYPWPREAGSPVWELTLRHTPSISLVTLKLIFHEIRFYEWETGTRPDIAFVVDQSHNLKGKIEAMLQTVSMAQSLYAKAALVDHEALAAAQRSTDLVKAEGFLQDAFATDVRGARIEWRRARRLPDDPIDALRQSGYVERVTKERGARTTSASSSYA